MPSIWQEVDAQTLGGWAQWVLVKVRTHPAPAGSPPVQDSSADKELEADGHHVALGIRRRKLPSSFRAEVSLAASDQACQLDNISSRTDKTRENQTWRVLSAL